MVRSETIFYLGLRMNETQQCKSLLIAMYYQFAENDSANQELRPTVAAIVALAGLLDTFKSLSEPYVSLANTHYSERAETNIQEVESGSMSPSTYIGWALDKVVEERDRACTCMDQSVAKQVVNVVRVQCGYKMSKRIVRRGAFTRRHHQAYS